MNLALVDKIANAVLYEGYLLYPYRASAVKNRQRWNFGAVYPAAFSVASRGTDACVMQTECLVSGGDHARIDIKVKFLQVLDRAVYEVVEDQGAKIEDGGWRIEDGGWKIEDGRSRMEDEDCGECDPQSSILNPPPSILHPPSSILHPSSPALRFVESLEVSGQLFQTWQEAVEREATENQLVVSELCSHTKRVPFSFAATSKTEPICDDEGRTAGSIIRRQASIDGAFEVSAKRLGESLFKITVRILNLTPMKEEDSNTRDEALMRAFVSTHTVLGVRGGEFVSLLDPQDELRDSASACTNVGTYPVLIGQAGEHDLMLSSPIILYDYPEIASESAGDLFDSTEIDEILTLRILTLTDEEKRQMRNVDDRARQILERTESMPLEQLMKLHGAVRGLRPVANLDES